jgi:hypothetical protein
MNDVTTTADALQHLRVCTQMDLEALKSDKSVAASSFVL